MATLSSASPPPPIGTCTTFESNCQYHYRDYNEDTIPKQHPHLTGYPRVLIELQLSSPSSIDAFLPQEETVWVKAWKKWKSSGLTAVLEEMSEGDGSWLSSMSGCLLSVVHRVTSLYGWLYPHLKLSCCDMIAEFSETSDWSNSAIRVIAWHPIIPKLAVAGNDDVVRIFCLETETWPQLKHKLQKHVACLAWRPLAWNTLAVGCKCGVVVWNVDPQIARPSSNAMQHLSCGIGPITSVSWNSTGRLLAAASPAHTTIMVWAVESERSVPLHRFGGGGIPFLLWSPDGSHVVSSSTSKFFRVWETQMWTCEKYSNMSDRLQSACWSPSGQILVFAVRGESCLYSLWFTSSSGDSSTSRPSVGNQVCVKCVDLSPYTFSTQRGDVTVGGHVQSLAWDSRGERLAILCTPNSPGAELIIICRTRETPTVEIIPSGFIRGPNSSGLPHCISFQSNFEHGALLSVGWSNRQVTFVPLYFESHQEFGTPTQSGLTPHSSKMKSTSTVTFRSPLFSPSS
ncbi:aladin-like [Corticium candelabrum]|uniref:aladin-like n=1 Tax=Corticium candelabrum TaxID=121492 RepID=UPI002E25F7A4|nr:aladin-like [Corticium candelabrum]